MTTLVTWLLLVHRRDIPELIFQGCNLTTPPNISVSQKFRLRGLEIGSDSVRLLSPPFEFFGQTSCFADSMFISVQPKGQLLSCDWLAKVLQAQREIPLFRTCGRDAMRARNCGMLRVAMVRMAGGGEEGEDGEF